MCRWIDLMHVFMLSLVRMRSMVLMVLSVVQWFAVALQLAQWLGVARRGFEWFYGVEALSHIV